LSKKEHHVEEIPEGLNINILTKESNGEYMESLIGEAIGDLLIKDKPELYEQIKNTTETWALIQGNIIKDENLNYMRDAIGIIQAFIETGAIAVLDYQTFTLYTSEEWTNKIFTPDFNPYSHVTILVSTMDDGKLWLHTRGLRKFGRPDVSMENVSENDKKDASDVINQMIFYSSKGILFENSTKLHTPKEKSFIINPTYGSESSCSFSFKNLSLSLRFILLFLFCSSIAKFSKSFSNFANFSFLCFISIPISVFSFIGKSFLI